LHHILGCVDGSLIDIATPADDEADYVDRRGNRHHSINMMAVCDVHMRFMYINVNNPGRNHDAGCFDNSAFGHRLAAGYRPFPDAVVLGDSGYTCNDYTITPLLAPNAPEEISFNVAHKRTRCIVERALGLLKARWRILLVKCDYQPLIASDIIRACCILHNISLQ